MQIRTFIPFLVASVLAAQDVAIRPSDRAFFDRELFGRMKWRSLGPANFGGRIIDFAVDEQRPATFFVATASGGIFRTTNNGTSFTPVFDAQPVTTIGDIAIAPSNPKVLYVGTGEANNQRSSYAGNG